MKHVLIVLLIVLPLAGGGFGFYQYQQRQRYDMARERLLQGDQYYREGKYREALQRYQEGDMTYTSPIFAKRIASANEAIEEEKQAKLATPTPAPVTEKKPVEKTPEKTRATCKETGATINAWIRTGQFQKIETCLTQLINEKTKTKHGYLYAESIIYQTFRQGGNREGIAPKFDQWIQQTQSSIAYTFRGIYYYKCATNARGSGWASTVTPEAWKRTREYLNLAAQDLGAAIKSDESNPLPYSTMMSILLMIGGNEDMMEAYFQRAIAYDPDYMQVYDTKLTNLMPKWGGSEQAMFAFARESIKHADKTSAMPVLLTMAHEEKAWSISKQERKYYQKPEIWAEVQSVYERLLQRFPESGWYAVEYARVLCYAGRCDEGRRYYDIALKRDPNNPDVLHERGRFFASSGDSSRALQEYLAALELDPYYQPALFRSAAIYYEHHQWSKAQTTYAKLIEIDSENSEHYYYRAETFFHLGKYREALDDYNQAIALHPQYELAYKSRAACYQKLGMTKEQQQDLKKISSLKK